MKESRAAATRAWVIGPYLDERRQARASAVTPGLGLERANPVRSHEARIAEAKGLAEAVDLDVREARVRAQQ